MMYEYTTIAVRPDVKRKFDTLKARGQSRGGFVEDLLTLWEEQINATHQKLEKINKEQSK